MFRFLANLPGTYSDTSDQLYQPPQTKDDEKTSNFTLFASQNRLEDEGDDDDCGVETVQRGMKARAKRIVVLESKCVDSDGYFDQKEGSDDETGIGEDVQPPWILLWAIAGVCKKCVYEINENAYSIDRYLEAGIRL